LAEYVTQKGNPGNTKKIAYAEIQLPVELLRRGFFFVDSPGLGSPIIENTLTTERFLPEADAFILVTSYESPLSEEEDRILQRIRNTNKKLFVVINKQDTIDAADRDEALAFVGDRLKQFSLAEPPLVFSISARQALEAKQSRSADQLKASGIEELETELMRFLTEERAQSFLSNMYERTLNFLIARSRAPERPQVQGDYEVLITRLRDLREDILGVTNRPSQAPIEESSTSLDTYTLEIDKKTGCRICGVILNAIFRFLSKYQYELTINPEAQQEHARRAGFCQLHTWQYEGISSPDGVCEAYPALVHHIATALKDLAAGRTQPEETVKNFRGLLGSAKTCCVCEVRIDAEKEAVNDVASAARRASESDGNRVPVCCLFHLAMVAEALGSGEPAQRLIESHARLLERTAEDLQRYALKHDALRRYLTSEEERQASLLALLLLAGHRNVSAPWVIESIF
jgi:GTP-binding protein EngB required for normal cell division